MVWVWVVTTAFIIVTFITVKLRGYKKDAACIAGRHCRRRDFWCASSPALPYLIGYLRLSRAAGFRRLPTSISSAIFERRSQKRASGAPVSRLP